jgi:uncharacterized membrane protein
LDALAELLGSRHAAEAVLTFFAAMIPVLELRFAIPFGVARGLRLWTSIWASVLGNLVPVPFIVVFITRIFAWLRRRSARFNTLVDSLERRAEGKKATVEKYAFWGLVVLVAIPLPGTGAWTGALVAAMMQMRLRRAFPAIAVGVVIAAVIVSVLTYGARMVFG